MDYFTMNQLFFNSLLGSNKLVLAGLAVGVLQIISSWFYGV
jgi:hypothetical protein